MTEDYKAKYEKLVLDYAKLATAYGELLARLSPPLPSYPLPAPYWQVLPWRVTYGSRTSDPLPLPAATTCETKPFSLDVTLDGNVLAGVSAADWSTNFRMPNGVGS